MCMSGGWFCDFVLCFMSAFVCIYMHTLAKLSLIQWTPPSKTQFGPPLAMAVPTVRYMEVCTTRNNLHLGHLGQTRKCPEIPLNVLSLSFMLCVVCAI